MNISIKQVMSFGQMFTLLLPVELRKTVAVSIVAKAVGQARHPLVLCVVEHVNGIRWRTKLTF